MLFIMHALHLADRVQGAYRHLPETLRYRLLRAAIVYQCWELQKGFRERGRAPRRHDMLTTVNARAYLGPVGKSGRHHLVEANDAFRYIVTIPSGLWTETLPATEVFCNELARILGLTVPASAVVTLGPRLLDLADQNQPEWLRAKARYAARPCCGFRYIDLSECDAAFGTPNPRRKDRNQLLGVLLFDLWVGNLRPGRLALLLDDATGRSSVIRYDNAKCLTGAEWSRFESTPAFAQGCPEVRLSETDRGHLQGWMRRIKDLDMNPVWQLAFEMPPSWYGGRRANLAELIDAVTCRRNHLEPEVERLMQSTRIPKHVSKACESVRGCAAGLACKIAVA